MSTSQCLHPDKFLAGVKPRAVRLSDLGAALGPGWDPIHEDTIGELGVDCLLKERLGLAFLDAPVGWAGDRLQGWGRESRTCIAWLTAWESEKDAQQMLEAAQALVEKDKERLAGSEVSRARRAGAFVALVLGAPSSEVADALLGAALPVR